MTLASSSKGDYAALQALLTRTLEELNRTRVKLQQAQELEAIGYLAASIARELSTPTQYITDNVTFAQRAFPKLSAVLEAHQFVTQVVDAGADPSEALERLARALQTSKLDYLNKQLPRALQQTLEGVSQLTALSHAMRELCHPNGAEKQPLDIHDIIESTSNIAKSDWKYVADLVFDFDWNLPPVSALRSELARALLSLILNAAHSIAAALPHGSSDKGKITITTRADGARAELRISDTGAGIPVAERALVFDPLVTSQELGRGGGRGLASAYAVIVDKHGGSLRFETEPGNGTTFIVSLPLDDRVTRTRVAPP